MLKVPIRLMLMTREHVERVRAVLADGLLAGRDAGAVDQAAQRAQLRRRRDDRLAVGFAT